MAVLSNTGAHCGVKECSRLDFLPFTCSYFVGKDNSNRIARDIWSGQNKERPYNNQIRMSFFSFARSFRGKGEGVLFNGLESLEMWIFVRSMSGCLLPGPLPLRIASLSFGRRTGPASAGLPSLQQGRPFGSWRRSQSHLGKPLGQTKVSKQPQLSH